MLLGESKFISFGEGRNMETKLRAKEIEGFIHNK